MILFTILTVILGILLVAAIAAIAIGGGAFIVIFSDLIVCIAIIVLFMKLIFGRKKRK